MAANAADDELQALFEALEVIGFVNDNQQGNIPRPTEEFCEFIGIESLEDLRKGDPHEDARTYFKDYNADQNVHFRMQAAHKSKLAVLIWWLKDQYHRALSTSHGGHVVGLTPLTLEMARVQWQEDISLSAESHSTLPAFDIRQWPIWRDKVIISLKRRAGYTGCPLYWIIRSDKPVTWIPAIDAINEQEKRFYEMSQAGYWYDTDNRAVSGLLLEACRGNTQAYTWIREHEAGGNGRAMWMNLVKIYDGTGEVNRREVEALAAIRPGALVYRGEQRGGEMIELITRLKDSYTTLESADGGARTYPDRDKVKLLSDAINTPSNNAMLIEKSQVLAMHRDNFEAACTYLSTRVIDIYPNASITQRGTGRNRTVGQTGRSRDINGIHIENIDNISNTEWHALGHEGQRIASRQRDLYRSTRPGGRGGGRGRGRGANQFGRAGRGGRHAGRGGGGRYGRGAPYNRNRNHHGNRNNGNNGGRHNNFNNRWNNNGGNNNNNNGYNNGNNNNNNGNRNANAVNNNGGNQNYGNNNNNNGNNGGNNNGGNNNGGNNNGGNNNGGNNNGGNNNGGNNGNNNGGNNGNNNGYDGAGYNNGNRGARMGNAFGRGANNRG